jgi:glutathione S-transferase
MPVQPGASAVITAFSWVPDFARGFVRDVRIRWALEEAGIPYAVELLNAAGERPAEYLERQPWGQVPAFRDGDVDLFESGAIALHIAERSDALLPPETQPRARAIAWLFAALNSVEPSIMQLAEVDIFAADQQWAAPSRPHVLGRIAARLDALERRLESREWLEDQFTIGDLMMAHVVRGIEHTDCIATRPALAAWHNRCLERPAYSRAMEAHLADFA